MTAAPQSETIPTRSRVSLLDALVDIGVITRRNLRRNIRLPQLVIFASVQPLMFLLLFNYVFGGAIGQTIPPAAGGEYINWLMPGLLIQVSAFGGVQSAVGLTEDLSKGVIDRFRALPMARSGVLGGRTFADLLRNVVVVTLMIVAGFLIGFRYQTGILGFLAGVGIGLLFSYAVSWAMATLGLYVRNPEAAQTAAFLPLFPLVFASSVFVPTRTMPGWLQAFADHQPITTTTNALRGLMLGEGALLPGQTVTGQVLLALAWIGGITLVFAFLSIRAYRRAVV